MKIFKTKILFLLFIPLIYLNAVAEMSVSKIEKYKIEIPPALLEACGNFSPGIGSGIEFKRKLNNNILEFYSISDRGPNLLFENKENKLIAFYPNFSPKIVRILVDQKSGKAIAKDFLDMKFNGQPVLGISSTIKGSQNKQTIYDSKLNLIDNDFGLVGLDSEAISFLRNGDFVVGDEYEPSINIVDYKTGEIKNRYIPGKGLPALLQYRNFNKGFESVAVAPNGKIYAILEGVLNLGNDSKLKAKLIRIVEIDPVNKQNRMFAYPFDYDDYEDSTKVKIGDMSAVDNENFILVEQGKSNDNQIRNVIYKINIKNATDITDIKTSQNQHLEYAMLEDLKSINFVSKELVINPRQYGWQQEKLEGLTIIDHNTIAITNDNDFELDSYEIKKNNKHCSKCVSIEPRKNNIQTYLWIIHLNKSL